MSGLEEAQLPALRQIELACADMYYAIGFDGAEVPPRDEADIVKLTRRHNVHVAEADHVVAGYVAWRDDSPGVGYVEELLVHPELQRFGVATRLLDRVRDEARELRLPAVVVRCWERATWAMGFYRARGFRVIDDAAPPRVVAWRDERLASGRPLTRPGEVALWAPVGEAAPDDDADASQG
jgi:amino-acid N-acetyltransferase